MLCRAPCASPSSPLAIPPRKALDLDTAYIEWSPKESWKLTAGKILIDGKAGELLLQIFSENQLGPIFFEFIQRKGDEGFGEGNFKALFESLERDQIRRGALETES